MDLAPDDFGIDETLLEVDPPEIGQWWYDTMQADYHGFGPKLDEYGAEDLQMIGRVLADMMGWNDAPARVHGELGCYFYLLGKIARMESAYRQHRLPSDDTLHDVSVYSMMARSYRERGTL